MGRVKSSEARRKWSGLLQAYEVSDDTVAEFCRKRGVSVPSFYQWKRKLAKEPTASFLPVVVNQPEAVGEFVRFQFSAEVFVEVPASQSQLVLDAMVALAKSTESRP